MEESCLCILFRMATEWKHNEVTLKAKYDELKELDKKRPNKEVVAQFNVPRIHFLVVTNQSRPLSDE